MPVPPENFDRACEYVMEYVRNHEGASRMDELIETVTRFSGLDEQLIRYAAWHLADNRKVRFDKHWRLEAVDDTAE